MHHNLSNALNACIIPSSKLQDPACHTITMPSVALIRAKLVCLWRFYTQSDMPPGGMNATDMVCAMRVHECMHR